MFREFQTSLGKVRGAIEGDVVRVSRLRYGKGPIGGRRFKLPEAIEPWEGMVDASGATVMAPQWPARLAAVMGEYGIEQSEDCLHLDLWLPTAVSGGKPVLVFLHGGAFISGGGGMPCYDGSLLATRGDLIVVNVSYRLGILGYLPIEGVAPPNLGLHDQRLALRFIRKEIAAFGGDPDRITVVGQSAGALSIAHLLGLARKESLFRRAVLLSAPLGMPLQHENETRDLAASFLSRLSIMPGDAEALSTAPIGDLLNAQRDLLIASAARGEPGDIGIPFKPVIDGDLITRHPLDDATYQTWCPLMVGATREEFGAFWFGRADLVARAEELLPMLFSKAFPGRHDEAIAAFRARRPGGDAFAVWSDLKTELEFLRPSIELLNRRAVGGGEGYAYQFDWSPPGSSIGACHCIELPFLFGNLDTWEAAPMLAGADNQEVEALTRAFQGAIIRFVRNGTPGSGTGLDWPKFEAGGPVLHFDRQISAHSTPFVRQSTGERP